MIFWEKIYEENIILWESKQENFAKIITITRIKLIEILSKNIDYKKGNFNKLNINYLIQFVLEEILKNSIDSFNQKNIFLSYLKTKKIKLKIFKKDDELFFLIRDNWKGQNAESTQLKKNNLESLWWMWKWEEFTKNLGVVSKFKRVSKKSWSVVLLKIDTLKRKKK